QFAPVLLFSLVGGVIADHVARRRLIMATQSCMMLVAFTLGLLTLTGLVEYWHVLCLAFFVGTTNAIDIPARQSFLIELTGREDLMNAIALHSSVFNAARFVGPAVGGLLIAAFSLPLCFLINGASFMAVLAGLSMIRLEDRALNGGDVKDFKQVWSEIAEGLGYIRNTSEVLYPILLMASLSLFAFNFNVLIPVFARDVLHQGAGGFGFLMGAHGIGALLAAVYLAYVSHHGPRVRVLFAGALGLCLAQLFLAPVQLYWLAWPLLLVAGLSMMVFAGLVNTTVQLAVPDRLRGRVMSVYSLVFLGMMPFGNLMAGAVARVWGAPEAFALSAVLGLCSLALLARRLLRTVQASAGTPVQGAATEARD
ncbi:MAG: MFS transporter, partial [Candidatus Desulforudis sp.]|nr:MFS transporter [Desulforudis sp.]